MIKTVSKDLAVQLKEAGFPQKTVFNWYEPKSGPSDILPSELVYGINSYNTEVSTGWNRFAAPTAEEVLELLPEYVLDDQGDRARLRCGKLNGQYWLEYSCLYNILFKEVMGESLAEAAGEMYLYLKAHDLLQGENV